MYGKMLKRYTSAAIKLPKATYTKTGRVRSRELSVPTRFCNTSIIIYIDTA